MTSLERTHVSTQGSYKKKILYIPLRRASRATSHRKEKHFGTLRLETGMESEPVTLLGATYSMTLATLLGAASIAALGSSAGQDTSLGLATAVNVVAAVHYSKMTDLYAKGASTRLVRYADWLITLPLLACELYVWNGVGVAASAVAMASCFLVVLFGYVAHTMRESRGVYAVASGFSVLSMLIALLSIFNDTAAGNYAFQTIVFSGAWLGYPFAEFLPVSESTKDLCFNLLDVFCKGVLAMYSSLM